MYCIYIYIQFFQYHRSSNQRSFIQAYMRNYTIRTKISFLPTMTRAHVASQETPGLVIYKGIYLAENGCPTSVHSCQTTQIGTALEMHPWNLVPNCSLHGLMMAILLMGKAMCVYIYIYIERERGRNPKRENIFVQNIYL